MSNVYDVTIAFYHTVTVRADNEFDAQELALSEKDIGECWEAEVVDWLCTEDNTLPSNYTQYAVLNPPVDGYVQYSSFVASAPVARNITLSNGYTTYC